MSNTQPGAFQGPDDGAIESNSEAAIDAWNYYNAFPLSPSSGNIGDESGIPVAAPTVAAEDGGPKASALSALQQMQLRPMGMSGYVWQRHAIEPYKPVYNPLPSTSLPLPTLNTLIPPSS